MATVLSDLSARMRRLSVSLVGIRQKFFQTALVLAITAGLFGAVELGLRLLFPDKVAEERAKHERALGNPFRFDARYVVGLKPNVEHTFERSVANGGAVIHWNTNSQGYRGPEFQAHPDVRVVVYGDSNIQARFSSLENTFVRKLRTNLHELSGRNVEVINAGVVGSGPDQSLVRLGSELASLHPDIVVLHVFADNDFGDLIRNQLFELDAEGRLQKTNRALAVESELIDPSGDLMILRAARRISKMLFESPPPLRHTADDDIRKMLSLSQQEFAAYQARRDAGISHFADYYDIDLAVDPTARPRRQRSG